MHYRVFLAIPVFLFLLAIRGRIEGRQFKSKFLTLICSNQYFAGTILVVTVSMFILTGYIMPKWGNKTPDSFWESDQYETYIYVKLYPEDKKQTSYLVKAKISAKDYHEYYIKKVVFVEGYGIVDLDCEEYLSTGQMVGAIDQKGRFWQVEMTDKVIKKAHK